MSDSDEPTVSFVIKDRGDAGDGNSFRMYVPKRKPAASNGTNTTITTNPPYRARQLQQSDEEAAQAMIAAVKKAEEVAANRATNMTNINNAPPRFIHRGASSPHIEIVDSALITSQSSSCRNLSDSQHAQDDENTPLYKRLTNQRWHEIGNGEYPICSTNDFDLMVDQLTAVLAARLIELLIYRFNKARKMKQDGEKKCNGGSMIDFLKLDEELGNYVLKDEIMDSLREYVACIGRLHNDVGFHSFEHATHVFLSMNKLLSMVTSADDLNVSAKRRLSAHDIAASAFVQSRRSSVDSTSSADSEGHRRRAEHLSFRISEDPFIRFAMVFSALIHDVGECKCAGSFVPPSCS